MVCLAVLTGLTGTAIAQTAVVGTFQAPPTVESLLKDGFSVVGAIPSQVGPGLFLQNKDQMFLCFVSETQDSANVTTRYCKPVQ
jgi:hypothetical protein